MEHYIFVFASFLPKKRACACQTSRVPMPRVLVDQDVKCGMKERRIIDTPPGSGHDRFSCVSIHRRIENKAHNQYPSIFLHARSFLPCLPNLLSNCLAHNTPTISIPSKVGHRSPNLSRPDHRIDPKCCDQTPANLSTIESHFGGSTRHCRTTVFFVASFRVFCHVYYIFLCFFVLTNL